MKMILDYLEAIEPMEERLRHHFQDILQFKTLKIGQFLLRAGHVCRHIYFIEKGLLHCFYARDLDQVSAWFMKEGDIAISLQSFFQQKTSYESIQALEDTELSYITYGELQFIYRIYPEFNFTARLITERYYVEWETRLMGMRKKKAKERYDFMVTHYPELLKRVPAKFMASLIGMTEVTLSNIKNPKKSS